MVKIFAKDRHGDLLVSMATSFYNGHYTRVEGKGENESRELINGIWIELYDETDDPIFIATDKATQIIEEAFREDKIDLSQYGYYMWESELQDEGHVT